MMQYDITESCWRLQFTCHTAGVDLLPVQHTTACDQACAHDLSHFTSVLCPFAAWLLQTSDLPQKVISTYQRERERKRERRRRFLSNKVSSDECVRASLKYWWVYNEAEQTDPLWTLRRESRQRQTERLGMYSMHLWTK